MLANTHNCELEMKSFEEEVLPVMDDDTKWLRIKRQIQLLITVSPKLRIKGMLRSKAIQQSAAKKHVQSKNWYIIHPFSDFLKIWSQIMFFTYLSSMITIPLTSAFPTALTSLQSLQTILDLIFCVDIILNFITGYIVHTTNEIIMDPGIIHKSYMKSYFFIDILTSIPNVKNNYFWRVIKLTKILRGKTIRELTLNVMSVYNIKDKYADLLLIAIQSILLAIWIGCADFICDNCTTIYHSPHLVDHLSKPDEIHNHLITILKDGVVCLFGQSSGSAPKSPTSALIRSISLIVCFIYFVYVQITILNFFIYEYASNTSVIKVLQEYMTCEKMAAEVQANIVTYYKFKFQDKYFREEVIMSMLSNNVRLCFSRSILVKMDVFRDLPDSVLDMVVEKLRPMIATPDEFVVKAGTRGDCMYLLVNGTMAIFAAEGTEICHLEDGSYFGESALFQRDHIRCTNVQAIEFCEMFKLNATDFRECALASQALSDRLRSIASYRCDDIKYKGAEYKDLLGYGEKMRTKVDTKMFRRF